MKRIVFRRLTAIDFKVYRDFSFDFEKFGPGCHGISGKNNVVPRLGSNGVGKSTLWDALCFALTGKTAKRLRSTDVQPYGSEADPIVRLELDVDGEPYVIERHAVPHKLSLNGLAVVQERLDEFTGLSLDLLLQTVVLAQGCPLFLDLEPRHKLSLLSDVLRLDRFETYSARAQTHLEHFDQGLNRLQLRLESVTGSIAEIGRQLAVVRSQSDAFMAKRKDDINELKAKFRDADDAAAVARRAVEPFQNTVRGCESRMEKVRQRLAEAEIKKQEAAKLQRLLTQLGAVCPTCGQPMPQARSREHLAANIAELIKAADFERTLAAYNDERNRYADARAMLQRAEQADTEANQVLALANHALTAAEVRDNPYKVEKHRLNDRMAELHKEERGITAERKELEKHRERMFPWVHGFKDIRLIILDDTLASLSLLTTSYANELGLPCEVKFGIERATKSGSALTGIHMAVEGAGRFEAWSGGEAQRLRLAASLALSATLLAEAGLSVNLLALDEPSAALSPEGLAELVVFLSGHAEAEGRSIFLTDQRRVALPSMVTLVRETEGVRLSA